MEIIKKTPIEQLQISDDFSESIIWHEFNLFRMPLFFISKKDVGTDKILSIKLKSDHGEGYWKVSPNVELGAGGPFEDELLVALNKIFTERPKPLTNPIEIGPLSGIARIMNYNGIGGITTNRIKLGIKRIASLLISSKYAFFDKESRRFLTDIDGVLHIINEAVFIGEKSSDGSVSDKNLIWINEKLLRSINSFYVTPLDIDFYMKMKDTEKALYKQLIIRFYANRKKKEPVFFKYTSICNLTTLKVKTSISAARQQLDPAHNLLLQKGFLSNFSWEKIKGNKKDWLIYYWPGPLAAKYINIFPSFASKKEINTIDYTTEELADAVPPVETPSSQGISEALFPSQSQKDVEKVADFYIKSFSGRFGEKPMLAVARDYPIIEDLLRQYSVEKVCALLVLYLTTSNDAFITQSGYTLPVFKSVINKLIIELNKKIKKSHENVEVSKNDIPDVDRAVMKKMISEFAASLSKKNQMEVGNGY